MLNADAFEAAYNKVFMKPTQIDRVVKLAKDNGLSLMYSQAMNVFELWTADWGESKEGFVGDELNLKISTLSDKEILAILRTFIAKFGHG